MDFSDFTFNKDKVPTDYSEKKKYFEELGKLFCNEIKDSQNVSSYFQNYSDWSVQTFIKVYAERKASLAQYYDYYSNVKQKRDLHFREKAEKAYEAIQQKKLFNLQLKWRAENITINEISLSHEFEFWNNHIDACKFLPLVTSGEIELMKQYLKEDDAFAELSYTFYDWQNYDQLMSRDEDNDFENMPAWYSFYDIHMGTGVLLLLPDIRGKKEEFYKELGLDDLRKKTQEENEKNPPAPYIPSLPYLNICGDTLYEFAQKNETDKYFLKLFEIYRDEYNKSAITERENEMVEEAISLLEDAAIPVIMPGGLEWRKAIIKCAQMYECEMISAELDALYSEYKMLNDLGISKGLTVDELRNEYETDSFLQWRKKFILKGRELNGDPADFNF